MRHAIFISALAVASIAMAHELDKEISARQVQLASALPQTIVIRVAKKDSTQVSVAHVKEKLSPTQKPTDLTFEQVALNSEVTGIAFNAGEAGRELDSSSSTSSWRFGFDGHPGYSNHHGRPGHPHGRPHYPYQGYRYPRHPYAHPYRYSAPRSAYPYYDNGYYGDGSYYGHANYGQYAGYYPTNYRPYYDSDYYHPGPRYRYEGYTYKYESYYRYEDSDYYYDYCRWARY
jgi:hypothetical protein